MYMIASVFDVTITEYTFQKRSKRPPRKGKWIGILTTISSHICFCDQICNYFYYRWAIAPANSEHKHVTYTMVLTTLYVRIIFTESYINNPRFLYTVHCSNAIIATILVTPLPIWSLY